MEIDVATLMDRPIWQMSGREFCALTQFANKGNICNSNHKTELCTGIHALAEQLGCCESTIYMLRREGVLDESVRSQVGKKIVFDVEKARVAADKYQRERRTANEK